MADGTVAVGEFGRVFTVARREQGFRSQAHLDAFYAKVDHMAACPTCGGPGGSYWSEADASWQPCGASCVEEQGLHAASFAERFEPESVAG